MFSAELNVHKERIPRQLKHQVELKKGVWHIGRFRIRISEDVDYSILNMQGWLKAKFKLFNRDFLIIFNKRLKMKILEDRQEQEYVRKHARLEEDKI